MFPFALMQLFYAQWLRLKTEPERQTIVLKIKRPAGEPAGQWLSQPKLEPEGSTEIDAARCAVRSREG